MRGHVVGKTVGVHIFTEVTFLVCPYGENLPGTKQKQPKRANGRHVEQQESAAIPVTGPEATAKIKSYPHEDFGDRFSLHYFQTVA